MSRHRTLRATLVAVAVLATTASVVAAVSARPDLDRAGGAEARARRVDPPNPVLVIGDSAIAAVRWVPGASGAVLGTDFVHLDLESCRRLVSPSCSGREGRRPPTALDALRAAGDRYGTVVIATGYNDSSATFLRDFRTIVEQARSQGVEQIVWFTLRTGVGYVPPGGGSGYQAEYVRIAQLLEGELATGAYPDVVVADWDGYTRERPAWFTSDGVHYTTLGAWAAADYLSRTLAFLEQRPCPLPVAPGEPVERPCPDPDVTGPVAQVAELYPIGQSGVLCYELGEDRTYVCRGVDLTAERFPESATFATPDAP